MFFLIFCVILGISLIVLSLKGLSYKPLITSLVGVLFIVVGIVGYLMQNDIIGGNHVVIGLFVYSYCIAAIFLVGIIINLSKIFAADTKIQAEFLGTIQVRYGLFPLYRLKFAYRYNHNEYSITTSDTVGSKVVNRLEKEGTCQVYINSGKPSVMVYSRNPGIGTWCMIFMFIALILVPIGYVTGFYGN